MRADFAIVCHAEHRAPDLGERGPGFVEHGGRCRFHARRRQRLAVKLAVGGQRHPVEHGEMRRHHVVGQRNGQLLFESSSVQPRAGRGDQVAGQLQAAIAGVARDHLRFSHAVTSA